MVREKKGDTHALELCIPWQSDVEKKEIYQEDERSPRDGVEDEEADDSVEDVGEWLEVGWEEHAADATEETHFG